MRNCVFLIIICLLVCNITCLNKSKRQINASCRQVPCMNGGKCIQVGINLAYCACRNGYLGKSCELKNSISTTSIPSTTTTTTKTNLITTFDPNVYYLPCPSNVPNPCFNNGKCFYSTLTKTINCECLPGFIDTFCI
ncbi:unnamed protein product, partial [Brachionus calyciflorus]